MINYAFVDCRIPRRSLETLSSVAREVVLLPAVPELRGAAIESHTDIILHKNAGRVVVSRSYLNVYPKIREALHSAFGVEGVIESEATHAKGYPDEAKYNALVAGGRLIARRESVCPDILALAEGLGTEIIPVRQGYPACAALAVGDGIISADDGLLRSLSKTFRERLKISVSPKIELAPYAYGFIGGSAGCYGKTVYFVGSLKAHPDGEKIEAFIGRMGGECVSLDPDCDRLFDTGGILFV